MSPDQKVAITATSAKKGASNGKIVFYDMDTFELKYQIEHPDIVSFSGCILKIQNICFRASFVLFGIRNSIKSLQQPVMAG